MTMPHQTKRHDAAPPRTVSDKAPATSVRAWSIDILLDAFARIPLSVQRLLGSGLGLAMYLSRTRMAQVSRENIDLCYGALRPESRRSLTRRSMIETGKTMAETAFAWKAGHHSVRNLINRVDNEAIVTSAIASGQGLIFMLPHIGNWEILNHYLGARYGLTHMYQPNKDQTIDSLVRDYRSRTGTEFVPASLSGIRAQLIVLRNGGTIGLMPDQEPDVHTGVFRRFFGVEALTGEMVRRYVEQTGCEVVIAICLRTRAGFRIQFCSTAISSDADPTRAMNEALERVIDGSPEQYLWSYKRFRTRPDGEAELYRLRQGGISRAATQVSLGTMLQLGQWIRSGDQLIRSLAWALGAVRPALKRSSIQNLMLCRPELAREVREELANASLRELVRTGLALPRAWRDSGTSQDAFNGTELLGNGATIVLTPPLGHRELVMDYLGKHHHTLEYYHPNSSDGLDRLIRRQRTAMGVALVPHTTSGEMMMANHLTMGHLVTLCPDQQPRLRGGLFIPFFGAPALTAAAIARILKSVAPTLVFGFAVREGSRYRIQFEPCPYDPLDDPETLLGTINRALESIILRFPEQYRWSDRRFNIRPPGHHKIYR